VQLRDVGHAADSTASGSREDDCGGVVGHRVGERTDVGQEPVGVRAAMGASEPPDLGAAEPRPVAFGVLETVGDEADGHTVGEVDVELRPDLADADASGQAGVSLSGSCAVPTTIGGAWPALAYVRRVVRRS
jgi:hypothetical protein